MMVTRLQGSLYLCIVAIILLRTNVNTAQQYKHIGCYKDTSDRALPLRLGYVYNNAVKECAAKAKSNGYNTFALQVGYECWSGPNAYKTYYKHGISTDCSGGVGSRWANDVYQFTHKILREIWLWPEGSYSSLKPTSGCTSQWVDNGWVFQDTVNNVKNNRSSDLHIDGYVTSDYVVRSFCTKTQKTSLRWQEGQYCIYKEDTNPPPGMQKGWIGMDNDWNNGRYSAVISLKYNNGIQKSGSVFYIYFFCMTTGVKTQPIDLPITHPFYLLPYGSDECQQVKWMVATREWIQYGTLNSWKGGDVQSYAEFGSPSHKGLTMFYCYYESCNKTLNNTKGRFQSPRFSGKYPDGQLCSWKIQVPADHTLHVYFKAFSLAVENGNDTDVLEHYRSTNDSTVDLVKVYRGSLGSFNVNSTSDLVFVFRSNQANSSSGFQAEYDIILDQEPTIGSPTTTHISTQIQPSVQPESTSRPTTVVSKSNDSSHDSFKDNRGGTGTIILIVIPLVCLLLVLVVTIDIIYRCRSRSPKETNKEDPRIYNEEEQVADNPTYGKRSETIPMTHFNSSTTVNTTIGQTDEESEQGYEKLAHDILPKHDVPEQYGQLNRSSQPITSEYQNDLSRASLQDNGPVYQTLEGPDSEPIVDDQMYHTIDQKLPSSYGLYAEKNCLYDSVA